MESQDKIFLQPGDIVTLKQDIPNKPTMIVVEKVYRFFKKKSDENILRGLRCRWFTTDGSLQEMIVSTKDLLLIKSVSDIEQI